MNKKLKSLSWDKLISLDIETVRGIENFDENHPNYDAWAWKCRDKDTNQIPEASVVISEYNNKAALYPEWGKIVCVSIGYVKDNELFVKSYTGEEKQILSDVVKVIKDTGRKILGHNVINFDIPYLRKRFFINGLTDYLGEDQGNDVYMKPWLLDDSITDTMVAWKGSGFLNSSLEELAVVFNLPTPKGAMHGNEVGDYFYSGRISEICAYCESDVATVVNLLRVWRGESILKPQTKTVVMPKDERTLLQRIYEDRCIGEVSKEEIKALCAKKKLTKKDKENLEVILRGVLIREDFENQDQDDKATILEKEEQIKELISELKTTTI